ncbi:MAG: hypothetical protein WDN24_04995 [Sphingomonas sp.]
MEDNQDSHRRDLPALVDAHADAPMGLTLRSAIASIPFVGSSISVIVEAKLNERQARRIDALYARLNMLETRLESGDAHAPTLPPSEALLEMAARAAATTVDDERPPLFANALYLEGVGDDRSEILRKFLLEVLATLTRYEMALLLRYAPAPPAATRSDFADILLRLHAENPEVATVRDFSLGRLAIFRLSSSKILRKARSLANVSCSISGGRRLIVSSKRASIMASSTSPPLSER